MGESGPEVEGHRARTLEASHGWVPRRERESKRSHVLFPVCVTPAGGRGAPHSGPWGAGGRGVVTGLEALQLHVAASGGSPRGPRCTPDDPVSPKRFP